MDHSPAAPSLPTAADLARLAAELDAIEAELEALDRRGATLPPPDGPSSDADDGQD